LRVWNQVIVKILMESVEREMGIPGT
jgi:hypothetical protein